MAKILLKFYESKLFNSGVSIPLSFTLSTDGSDNDYWWWFLISSKDIIYRDNQYIIVDETLLDKFKALLKKHSFNKVRYQAKFHPENIKFKYELLGENVYKAISDVELYEKDYLGLQPLYLKTVKAGNIFSIDKYVIKGKYEIININDHESNTERKLQS